MSKEGVKQVANIFSQMQATRINLLGDPLDKQDLRFAVLLDNMKDFGKDDFMEIVNLGDKDD